jgi:DNA-binding HxlR family transcriptional regulator
MTKPHHSPPDIKAVCAVEAAVCLLEGKWKCIILFHLLDGTARFGALRRLMPKVTQRTLTNQLRELEFYGLLERKVYAEVPARVEYTISPLGRTFEPVLLEMKCWGERLLDSDRFANVQTSVPPTTSLN